nr:cysteine peptidase family C39 domain-containing protein [Klebsiella grimontii]
MIHQTESSECGLACLAMICVDWPLYFQTLFIA